MSRPSPILGAGGRLISRTFQSSISSPQAHFREDCSLFVVCPDGMWPVILWGFGLCEGFAVVVVEGKVDVSLWASCAWVCS